MRVPICVLIHHLFCPLCLISYKRIEEVVIYAVGGHLLYPQTHLRHLINEFGAVYKFNPLFSST